MDFYMRHLATILILSATFVSVAHADPTPPGAAYEIFSKNTSFHVTGDDKLVVFGVADPQIAGIVCTFTAPVKGGIRGALGFAAQTSDVSLACRQVAPISMTEKFSQGGRRVQRRADRSSRRNFTSRAAAT